MGVKDNDEYKGDVLPAPTLPPQRARLRNVGHNSEIRLIIEQRVPQDIAIFIGEKLNNGERVHFSLQDLEVIALHGQDRAECARLDLGEDINIYKAPDYVKTSQTINLSVGMGINLSLG